MGYLSPTELKAACFGALILLIAVALYYGGNGVFHIRSNSDIWYLSRKAEAWGLISLIVGTVCGLLGWACQTARSRLTTSLARGIAFGSIIGQGIYLLTSDRSYLFGPRSASTPIIAIMLVTLPVLLLLFATRSALPRIALPAALVSAAGGAFIFNIVSL
jgi:hypothetical protein